MSLLLPKSHISWSQYTLWKSSPERYKREYFENAEKLDTKYLRFGKGIAEMIELGTHKTLLPDLLVYEICEYEIRTEIDGVPVLSYIDSYDPKDNVFREYKTGKHAWTNVKVQRHDQLLFYAIALEATIGTLPKYCDLDWIETTDKSSSTEDFWQEVDKTLRVTGKIVSFRRHFDKREAENFKKDLVKVANEISEAYKKFISEL